MSAFGEEPQRRRRPGVLREGIRAGGVGCVGCITFIVIAFVALALLLVVAGHTVHG